jgi:hypothetical protein
MPGTVPNSADPQWKAWVEEDNNAAVKRLLGWTARKAALIVGVLFGLQFVAMLATAFLPLAALTYLNFAILVVIALACVVGGGSVWAGVRVWQDAEKRRDVATRLHLVVAPLGTLLLALYWRAEITAALNHGMETIYGSALAGASGVGVVPMLLIGLVAQAFVLSLLVLFPLGAIYGLSMTVHTVNDEHNKMHGTLLGPVAAGFVRFAFGYVLAFAAWAVWLPYFAVGLI